MKSYKHLFDICISEENRRRAIQKAKRTKRIRKMIRKRHLSDEAMLALSYDWIINYENAEHTPIVIQDGIRHKERVIIVPTLEELIVQHCVVMALGEMFWRGLYRHSYASIPGRGAHKAKKVMEKWIDTDPRNVKYVLKMDIRHFFDSIQHDVRQAISEYLEANLGLELKGDWQVFRFSYTVNGEDRGRPLDFMGFQFYRNRTVLRKSIMLKATRKARRIHKKPYQGRKPTVHDYRQMMSYLGWIDCTDTYRMYLKHIKPRISFQRMKRYISRYDRHDDRRVYEQLVQLYLPRGGKRRGTRLYHRRKYRPPQGNRGGRDHCIPAPQHC